MSINKKLLGEAELIKKPQKKLNLTIKDGAITSGKIKDKAITARKLGDDVLASVILPLINQVRDNLQNQIDALEVAGVALSGDFGDSTTIGIHQKKLTESYRDMMEIADEISGEYKYGFGMTLTESFRDGMKYASVMAWVPVPKIFESVQFFINDTPDGNPTYNTSGADIEIPIGRETIVKCVGVIDGITYTKKMKIEAANFAEIKTCQDSSFIFRIEPNTIVEKGSCISKDITFGQGSHLQICIPSQTDVFLRADMNGIEIPMEMRTQQQMDQIIGSNIIYNVYTSIDGFTAGTYNIDFNFLK